MQGFGTISVQKRGMISYSERHPLVLEYPKILLRCMTKMGGASESICKSPYGSFCTTSTEFGSQTAYLQNVSFTAPREYGKCDAVIQ